MRIATFLALLFLISDAKAQSRIQPGELDSAGADIVFICEHGAAKSVLASALFNRAAQQQKLPFRSVARGLRPDAQVPPKIVAALRADGFDLADFQPAPVDDAEIASASHVVAIGVESSIESRHPEIEMWNDIPSPADYAAARAALQRQIDALLEAMRSAKSVNRAAPQTESDRGASRR